MGARKLVYVDRTVTGGIPVVFTLASYTTRSR